MAATVDPSAPPTALTTVSPAGALLPTAAAATAVDDLGPAICPTCGSYLLDGMDPLRAVSGVLLSLLASVLGVAGGLFALVGLATFSRDGLWPIVAGLVMGGTAVVAGYFAHRTARRPERHRTTCRVCGQSEGRWTSSSSERFGVVATLFAGPLLLPGLLLLVVAFETIPNVSPRTTLAEIALGLGLLTLAMAIVRRPWTAAHGLDRAAGSTVGRLFLGGEGVGTSPWLRPVFSASAPADALLTPTERAVAAEVSSLVSRRIVALVARDDIVWTRLLSYHRLTIVPSTLFLAFEPSTAVGTDESPLVEALVNELRTEARLAAGGDGVDYRAEHAVRGRALDDVRVRLPLRELLARAGVPPESALAVEGALRASVQTRRLPSKQYAALRSAGGTPVLPRAASKQ